MADTSNTIVVALGGNAISRHGQPGDIPAQFAQSQKTAVFLADAVELGYQLVITHGNGPQVGNILRRVEIASEEIYPIPLEVCVADTQAGMGYMIAQCLMNELAARGMPRAVTTLVTTVRVDADSPAFDLPTKPIGPFFSQATAQRHIQRDGWTMIQVNQDAYQRVVASPEPREILEIETIRRLVSDGSLLVCCGGGGIPVQQDVDGAYRGVPAVIDKDRTSAMLALELSVRRLVLLTSVDYAYLDFATDRQRAIKRMNADEAGGYLQSGQFSTGSMKPKVQAAIDFVQHHEASGAAALIARLEQFIPALDGKAGTWISR